MDLVFKMNRLKGWSSALDPWETLKFEVLWSCKRRLVHVHVPGYREPFFLRRHSSDLSVFETVFMDREFEWYLPEKRCLIIDGGANIGLSTAFIANRFPGARISAVEPSGEYVSLIHRNCRGMNNITVMEGGCGLSRHTCASAIRITSLEFPVRSDGRKRRGCVSRSLRRQSHRPSRISALRPSEARC